MSKISKLIFKPRLFFSDALRKRSRANLLANSKTKTLYFYRFNDWKKNFIYDFFAGNQVEFLPFKLTATDFKNKFETKILKRGNVEILVWGMNAPSYLTRFCEQNNIPLKYVEDGFIRSIGLGAEHTVPLSMAVDSQTLYFNAQQPSDLESILSTHDFEKEAGLLDRSRAMMARLLQTGISKYNQGQSLNIEELYGEKTTKRVLVIGQVEDDASIKYGCSRTLTNNDLVRIAYLENPDAQIIYKPHPDVLHQKRQMQSNPAEVQHICRILDEDISLSQSFETIDHVYTITSLSGFEALLRGIKVTTLGCPFYSGWGLTDDRQPNPRRTRQLSLEEVFAGAYLLYPIYFDPIYKTRVTPEEALERLIELKNDTLLNMPVVQKAPVESQPLNKTIYFYRFNDWKKNFIYDFFAGNQVEFLPFKLTATDFKNKFETKILKRGNVEILVWGMNAPSYLTRFCEQNNIPLKYVEDGFIRSIGLGAEHTVPLSMAIDSQTLYFNAQQPSDLENILSTHDFEKEAGLLDRSRAMMARLLQTGISKYNQGQSLNIEELYGEKTTKRVLVIGQVEDDASIKYGCSRTLTNNDLVRIAYLENPDAQIIYKPHPDVLHQKRQMQSNPAEVQHICRILDEDISLSQSFETIDHVYTITSLSGFEALLRGIKVTTLGCPFYSGWGLTDDRQPNPRRTRQLSLEEVFAGAYLLYPIYFDPIYKTRVTPEEALERLIELKNDTLLNMPVVQKAPVESQPLNKTIYFYRFNDWKKNFIYDFFAGNQVEFFPFKLTATDFKSKFEAKILKKEHAEILVWGMNAPSYLTRFCEKNNIPLKYVEDGFIRSIELGAEHTVPLSMAIDSQTLYFNAQQPSDLENILSTHDFEKEAGLLDRSRAMMARLLQTGISKYNQGQSLNIEELYGEKTTKRVLVIGQVEDDASIKYGCSRTLTNNDLVRIAYLENPDAQIIYKPHPDVLHQKRQMQSNPAEVQHICRILDEDISLSQSFETIDHVYTITSLSGFEALLRGIKVTTLGCPFYSGWGLTDDRQPNPRRTRQLSLEEVFAGAYLLYPIYFDPIYKTRVTPEEALERLIGLKNEPLVCDVPILEEQIESEPIIKTLYFYRFNDWKKNFIYDFFAGNQVEFFPFKLTATDFKSKFEAKILKKEHAEILVWGMNAPSYLTRFCEKNNIPLKYVEDGFIRSIGLGAEHTVPLSMAIDSQTLYFNAQQPSDLENILSTHDFEKEAGLLDRSRAMMARLLQTGISKYNQGQSLNIEELYGEKTTKRVLVIGQVEDDASIKYGCSRTLTNNDLVRIAYLENPDAQIIYKPHPDVLHQKRQMQSNPAEVQHICRILDEDISLSQSFETIDHVYTITSLSGFEALLRGIKVTTLGCPFYSGWGLTDDRQPNPRRTRQLSLEEVFAGAYLLYPIYFDPIYKTRVTPEEALERLIGLKNEPLVCDVPILEEQIESEPIIKTLYFYRFNDWKKNFIYDFFAGNQVEFFPFKLTATDFKSKFEAKILKKEHAEILVWGMNAPSYLTRFCEKNNIPLKYVEDGFIRSIGLGAEHTVPLSMAIDSQTLYFNAQQPSDLENILSTHDFEKEAGLLDRSRAMMARLLQTGISKYNQGQSLNIEELYGEKTTKRVLVIGQVEDDASIKYGCSRTLTNNDLVHIAHIENPDAQIIYKPHPDVLHQKRQMQSNPAEVQHICRVLDEDISLSQSFETIDHVYTITSLSGFEALLRGIKVTTLGCPFYSGWGLTDDRQPNPRRTRQLSLEEVFAGAYLLYPIYFDPIYKTRVTPEEALERLIGLKNTMSLVQEDKDEVDIKVDADVNSSDEFVFMRQVGITPENYTYHYKIG